MIGLGLYNWMLDPGEYAGAPQFGVKGVRVPLNFL